MAFPRPDCALPNWMSYTKVDAGEVVDTGIAGPCILCVLKHTKSPAAYLGHFAQTGVELVGTGTPFVPDPVIANLLRDASSDFGEDIAAVVRGCALVIDGKDSDMNTILALVQRRERQRFRRILARIPMESWDIRWTPKRHFTRIVYDSGTGIIHEEVKPYQDTPHPLVIKTPPLQRFLESLPLP